MLNRVLFAATLALATASFAVTDVDVFLASPKRLAVPGPLPEAVKARVALGRISSTEPRLGVPTFFWAPRVPNAPDLRLLGLTPENVARRALFDFAPLYRTAPAKLAEAKLTHVHDSGDGAITSADASAGAVVVQFEHVVGGLKVFHERINVVMSQRLEVIALTGAFSALPLKDGTFKLTPTSALSVAFDGSFGSSIASSQFLSAGVDDAGGLRFDAPSCETHSISLARTMQVAFPDVDGRTLLPAYYVELEASPRTSTVSELVGTVVSALDGRVLWRHSLTEADSYVYRVWADPVTLRPLDGPNGRATPHPTGNNDFTVMPFVQPSFVTLGNAGISTMDDWLGPAATESTGNNVEAYADITAPDGFSAGDVRGVPTANAFADLYEVSAPPNSSTQRNAGIAQLFYDVNWLHDVWYDKGFDEASGNAQTLNFGRGGAEGDSIKAESQDSAGLNNANMSTPADGARPRMQMFLWTPSAARTLTLTPGPSPSATGTGAFGPTNFTIPASGAAPVLLANDGTAPSTSDACQPITNNVTGAIVVVDRGNCGFHFKALTVQQAGGIGIIIANNAAGAPPNMAADATITTPITIGALSVSQADGTALKTALQNGPVTASMSRTTPYNRDGSVDNTVVAHEWGHYISNRLIPGLGTQQARGMGEGWGDTMALLMTTEQSDAPGSANANFGGVYALAVWDMDSPALPTNAAYFGIRRAPYSVNFAKNGLTFGHISDGATLPTHPLAPGGASNSEVHNVGEVWAVMLWECYVAMLRDTPRLTFAQAQDRMMRYLVTGMKAMPSAPTFVEARDAILAAAAANSVQDFRLFADAFARRGLGLLAVAPDRASTTLTGAVEDFQTGNEVAFVGAQLLDDDSVEYCDRDGVLDVGEKGRLRITLRNTGYGDLTMLTANLTSSTNGVVITPATLTFPTLAPFQSATVDTAVRLPAGLTSRLTVDFTVSFSDPSLRTAGPRTATVSFIANQDSVANSAASDDFEATPLAWTFTRSMNSGTFDWERVEVDPMNHRLFGIDAPAESDLRAESPTLTVGPLPFTMTFQNRWSFEYTATPTVTAWDGAVLEISPDNGMTWVDVTTTAGVPTPPYNGTLTNTSGNPLQNRQAWVGDSANYPMFGATTLDFGTTLAGQLVKVRFRVGSDQNSAEVGWDIDDVVFTGLLNTPFPSVAPHRNQCLNRPPVANAGPDQLVDERTMVTLTHAMSTDPDGDMLTPTWTQTAGPMVTLTNGVFTAPEVMADTTLRFSLRVNDGTVNSANTDEVEVRVRQVNRPPVVMAGADQTIDERAPFQLLGTASDVDGDPLTIIWRQVSGPATTLTNTGTLMTGGQAPEVMADATVVFELRINDGTIEVSDTVSLTVRQVNRPPTAQALADGFVDSGAAVTLTGFVVDPDGDATTVLWTQTAGPMVELFTATALSPAFTAPTVSSNTTLTFQLVARDAALASAPATVSVVVRGNNAGPIARPGMDITLESGASATLDGSASSDPDGQPLTFLWQQEGEGSRLTLEGASSAQVKVTAPHVSAQEKLAVVLYVRDASGAVGNATVHVIVTPKTSGCGCASVTGFEPALLGLLLLAFRRRAKK
ncbi:MAG: myxosortase-dependent M36 family metallopeptidase [Archangium sp.]|nr:myxosortase-dependent M36 family metallopeptidase [Archangium sp.]